MMLTLPQYSFDSNTSSPYVFYLHITGGIHSTFILVYYVSHIHRLPACTSLPASMSTFLPEKSREVNLTALQHLRLCVTKEKNHVVQSVFVSTLTRRWHRLSAPTRRIRVPTVL